MERQAKERLTGGFILVALLVLLVPELLSGPSSRRATAPTEPDQAPMRAYTVDLSDTARNSAPAPAQPAQPADNAAIDPTPSASAALAEAASVASAPGPAPTPGSRPTPPGPPPTPAARPTPEPAPALRPAAASQPQPQAQTQARSARPAPTPAASTGTRPPQTVPARAAANVRATANPASAGKEWSVQLGVFSNRANAQRLVEELKSKGFEAQMAQIGSEANKRFRVRVGPARDEVTAQRLRTRLKAAGQSGAVVIPP